MKEKERLIVTGLVVLMLVLWLGFPFHKSPRFAGSLWGGALGVAGAVLMLIPLLYLFVKRIKWLKNRVTQYISMRTLLAWHIYAGVLGPILVVIHSGHKYESQLGIALTAVTLLVVVSGFIGRYLMNRISQEIRDKKALLTSLQAAYHQATNDLAAAPEQAEGIRPFVGSFSRLFAGLFLRDTVTESASASTATARPVILLRLSESIADVEYSIKSHEGFKAWFGKWLKFHIVISIVLYVLMALHIWAAIHFGLRWFNPKSATHFRPTAAIATRNGEEHTGPHNITPRVTSDFARHYERLCQNHWRGTATINGYRTTVLDYAGIASEVGQVGSDLSNSLASLDRLSPERVVSKGETKAFWINVYNLAAINLVAQNYPVPSIIDAKIDARDPWGVPAISVGGTMYSLKQIESEILLRKFNDPRIVFAISCAAVSCPNRSSEIFTADRVEEQLDAIVQQFLTNETKGMVIDRSRNQLTLSWIFKADRRLFGDKAGLLDFVGRYATKDDIDWIRMQRNKLAIDYFQHDWTLNDLALAGKRE